MPKRQRSKKEEDEANLLEYIELRKKEEEGELPEVVHDKPESGNEVKLSTTVDFGNFSLIKRGLHGLLYEDEGQGFVFIRDILSVVEANYMLDLAPRWRKIASLKEKVSNTCFVFVSDMESDYRQHLNDSDFLRQNFSCVLRVAPEGNLNQEMLLSFISMCDPGSLIRQYGSIEVARREAISSGKSLDAVYEFQPNDKTDKKGWFEKISRTSLILPLYKLMTHGIPSPLRHKGEIKLCEQYRWPIASCPMIALDIEDIERPIRIAVIDETYKKVLDKLINHATRKTGDFGSRFPEEDRLGVLPEVWSIDRVIEELRNIVQPETIILGHNIGSDLRALGFMHPLIIDTQDLFDLNGDGTHSTLQDLCDEFLKRESADHLPQNDARVTMKLVQLKLNKGHEFGNKYIQNQIKQMSPTANCSVIGNTETVAAYEETIKKILHITPKNLSLLAENSSTDQINKVCALQKQSNTVTAVLLNKSENFEQTSSDIRRIWDEATFSTFFILVFLTEYRDSGTMLLGLKSGESAEPPQLVGTQASFLQSAVGSFQAKCSALKDAWL